MEFLELNSGKMLNLNSVTLISVQYNAVVYELVSGNADKAVYEEFATPEEAKARYDEICELVQG